MTMREDIEKLLKSDISAYRIGKETSVPESNVKRLRSRYTEINNIRFHHAESLSSYYKQLKKRGEIK